MQIDFSKIPNAVEVRLGLARPNWDVIAEWVDLNVVAEKLDNAWTEIARQWLVALQAHLGADYTITESENFLLLSYRDEENSELLTFFCERSLQAIRETLAGVAQDDGYRKHVVLAFASEQAYFDYVADYYPDEGEFALSGGMFIDRGYGHIVFPYYDDQSVERTIAHEITHSMLRHLPLPLWLNEGVTQIVEEIVCGHSVFHIDRELAERHRAYWSANSLDSFWSGDSFDSPGDGQELSYNLAQVLVRNLLADHRRKLLEFVGAAEFIDAGESAARDILGVMLRDRAAEFLGPGDWMPRGNYGQEQAQEPASAR